ncbi:MAG: T9SS type A sorting domain-containing protein, partial [Candidatus Eisenbacteria bacterium]|nr:T9SS type A sorting domain-containing protein [Candidatus Eisenbacteria bacterium]
STALSRGLGDVYKRQFCASSIDLDSYARVSGTSLATPLMAGLAALLLEARPDWTPDSLLARLRDSGDRSSQPNSDEGWGVPDGLRALRSRAARLQTLRLVWQEEGAGDGHPGWEEHGTLGVWLANVGPTASEQALLSIESHDEELAITGDEVVAVGPIAPGDSVLVPSLARVVLPERPEGVALGEFRIFLGIEEGGIEVDRALLLTVGRPYALTRFEATPDPTGSVTISWDLDVDASYFGQNALHGFHLYRIHGQDSERLDGVLIDRGVRRWLDRPGAPGSYSYVLELQFRNGVLRYQEGPVVANVAMPGRSLLGKPYPNPATGTLTIPLVSLSEAAQRIEIFTATGRRVRTIEWNAPVGYGLLDWDAKDDGGRDVPSGLYILKQSGGSTARVWVVR